VHEFSARPDRLLLFAPHYVIWILYHSIIDPALYTMLLPAGEKEIIRPAHIQRRYFCLLSALVRRDGENICGGAAVSVAPNTHVLAMCSVAQPYLLSRNKSADSGKKLRMNFQVTASATYLCCK
jgi:hypothetical protein